MNFAEKPQLIENWWKPQKKGRNKGEQLGSMRAKELLLK